MTTHTVAAASTASDEGTSWADFLAVLELHLEEQQAAFAATLDGDVGPVELTPIGTWPSGTPSAEHEASLRGVINRLEGFMAAVTDARDLVGAELAAIERRGAVTEAAPSQDRRL